MRSNTLQPSYGDITRLNHGQGRLQHDYESTRASAGGLAWCKVCGGAEGSLPTHCPGEHMERRVEDRVYAGVLDFVDGEWIQPKPKLGLVIRFPWRERYEDRPPVPLPGATLRSVVIAAVAVDPWRTR